MLPGVALELLVTNVVLEAVLEDGGNVSLVSVPQHGVSYSGLS